MKVAIQPKAKLIQQIGKTQMVLSLLFSLNRSTIQLNTINERTAIVIANTVLIDAQNNILLK
jgi:hypothetical protein